MEPPSLRRSYELVRKDGRREQVPEPTTYAEARAEAAEVKRLQSARYLQERLERQYFERYKVKHESDELLRRGAALEEVGRLDDACRMYERVLAQHPANLELRLYVGLTIAEINAKRAEERRLQALMREQEEAGARSTLLRMPTPPPPRGRKGLPRAPPRAPWEVDRHARPSPRGGGPAAAEEARLSDLQRQVEEVRRKQEAVRAEEAALDRRHEELQQRLARQGRATASARERQRRSMV